MTNFKLKRVTEHPSESTNGVITLAQHIANPNAHVVTVNTPVSQVVNLTINNEDKLKELLDNWYASVSHTHDSLLTATDISNITEKISTIITPKLSNYSLIGHTHSQYLTSADVESAISEQYQSLDISDMVRDTISLDIKKPDSDTGDKYATRNGVSAYLPGKNVVDVDKLFDYGNYCLTSYQKNRVFVSDTSANITTSAAEYTGLVDKTGTTFVDFTENYVGLLNVYCKSLYINNEFNYLCMQKLTFMQHDGKLIRAFRYGTSLAGENTTYGVTFADYIANSDGTVSYIAFSETKFLQQDYNGSVPEDDDNTKYVVSSTPTVIKDAETGTETTDYVVTVNYCVTSSLEDFKANTAVLDHINWNSWKIISGNNTHFDPTANPKFEETISLDTTTGDATYTTKYTGWVRVAFSGKRSVNVLFGSGVAVPITSVQSGEEWTEGSYEAYVPKGTVLTAIAFVGNNVAMNWDSNDVLAIFEYPVED